MKGGPHIPTDATRAQVEALAGLVGLPQSEIAKYLGIDEKTLRKYYRAELNLSATQTSAAVAKALYTKAVNGDTTAMIFWLKTRTRWRETGDDADKLLKSEQARRLALENKLLELRVKAAEAGGALGADITVVLNQTPYSPEEIEAIRAAQEENA